MASAETADGSTWRWRLDKEVMDHDLGNIDYEKDRMKEKYERAVREQEEQDELALRQLEEDQKNNAQAKAEEHEKSLANIDDVIENTRAKSADLDALRAEKEAEIEKMIQELKNMDQLIAGNNSKGKASTDPIGSNEENTSKGKASTDLAKAKGKNKSKGKANTDPDAALDAEWNDVQANTIK